MRSRARSGAHRRPVATAIGALGALIVALLYPSRANAQALQRLALNDYWVDYVQSAHAFVDTTPIVPTLAEGTPWANLKDLLMRGRRTRDLYLLGDDALHLYPTRLGILGWGFSAGLRF